MKKIVITCVAVLVGGIAFADVVDITVGNDADIRGTAADWADGFRADHRVSANANSGKTYLRFVLPGDVDTINSATLTLILSDTPYWNASIDVYGLNDTVSGQNWGEVTGQTNTGGSESGLTWNNAPGNDTSSVSGFLSGDTTSIGSIAVSGSGYGGAVGDVLTISGANLVAFLNADSDEVANILLGTTFTSSDVLQVASKNQATYAAPKLTIDYVAIPEPATMGLLGIGSALVFAFRRMRG